MQKRTTAGDKEVTITVALWIVDGLRFSVEVRLGAVVQVGGLRHKYGW